MFSLFLLLQTSTPDWALVQTYFSPSNQYPNGSLYGYVIRAVRDLDGDGVDDLLIGAPGLDVGGGYFQGAVEVKSGASLNPVYQLTGNPGSGFGFSIEPIEDLDGDGRGDFLVGEFNINSVHVFAFSGATGSLLLTVNNPNPSIGNFGVTLAALGDITSDGVPDFAVGASQAGASAGAVYVYSGATGTMLFQKLGWRNGQQFGMRLRGGGDFNQDGVPDLMVMDLIRGHQGRVTVYSGVTFDLLLDVDGLYDGEFLGSGMDFIPDLDGDGGDDFVLGSPDLDGGGFVTAFSGLTGQRLWTTSGIGPYDDFGEPVLTVPDVNGDGYSDVLVGAIGVGPLVGAAVLLSGRTGSHLSRFDGAPAINSGHFGGALAWLSRTHGITLPTLVIGANAADSVGPPGQGEVYVYEARPFLQPDAFELSAAAGGTLTLTLDFPDTEAGKSYQVLASSGARGGFRYGGLEIPLVPNAFFHSFLRDTPGSFAGASGSLDAAGNATATLTLPAGALAAWAGHTVKVAAVSLDPNQQPELVSWARAIRIIP